MEIQKYDPNAGLDKDQIARNILSDITVFMKYARYRDDLSRRETWDELVERNMDMHIKKYPHIEKEIRKVYKDFVFPRKVLPSMRSLQFAGKAIEQTPSRIYNCANIGMDDPYAFAPSSRRHWCWVRCHKRICRQTPPNPHAKEAETQEKICGSGCY